MEEGLLTERNAGFGPAVNQNPAMEAECEIQLQSLICTENDKMVE